MGISRLTELQNAVYSAERALRQSTDELMQFCMSTSGTPVTECYGLLNAAARAASVPTDAILGHARPQHLVDVRMALVWILRHKQGESMHGIARILHRTPSYTNNMLPRILDRIEIEPKFRDLIDRILSEYERKEEQ